MNKKELESYLIRRGWRQEHNDVYEKEPIPLRRLKLLKTSIKLEVWTIGSKWKKVALVHYKNLELDSATDKLYVSDSNSPTPC